MDRDSQTLNYNTFYDNIDQILKDLENEDETHKPKPCITNDNHVNYIKDFEEMMMKGTVYCNAQHLLAKMNICLSLIKCKD